MPRFYTVSDAMTGQTAMVFTKSRAKAEAYFSKDRFKAGLASNEEVMAFLNAHPGCVIPTTEAPTPEASTGFSVDSPTGTPPPIALDDTKAPSASSGDYTPISPVDEAL